MDRPLAWDDYYPIFDAALDIPAEDRAAYLDQACADRPDVRAKVESLLASADDTTGASSPSVSGSVSDWASALLGSESRPTGYVGVRVGPFELREEIGRGGMGVVYRAERVDGGFEQTVAVKVIASVLRSADAMSRFTVEQQILARLEHPGIARLVDGGLSDEGIPYLAMEYVAGTSISRYCADNRLSIAARLALFENVCAGVQYAHENLIVHRDLKPGNILVNEAGEPKLLDFGIAKVIDDEALSATVTAQALTPRYAAPEQVRGEQPSVATDVYALGMILYELLTEARPYAGEGETSLSVQRAILEEEPAIPSRMATDPATRRALSGDLDAILLKALRKEPAARYGTVSDLVRDLIAHRENEPVTALRGSRSYRWRKFIRRNRLPLSAAAAVVLALSAGLVASLVQTNAATRAREDALSAQAETAAINEFLVNELLASPTPEKSMGEDLRVRDVLENASRTVEFAFPDQPAVEASLRQVLARSYASLGNYDLATEHAGRALELDARGGDHDRDSDFALDTRDLIARVRLDAGEHQDARRELEHVLAERRRRNGPDAVDVLNTEVQLARLLSMLAEHDSAAVVLESATARLDTDHADDWESRVAARLAWSAVANSQSLWEQAESLCREAMALQGEHLPEDHPRRLEAQAKLAGTLLAARRYEEAIEAWEDLVARIRRVFGPNHIRLARALSQLGTSYARVRRLNDAESVDTEARRICESALGPEHPFTLHLMSNTGILADRLGNDAKAESLYVSAFEGARRALGAGHPRTIRYQYNLINRRMRQSRIDEARSLTREMHAAYEQAIADSLVDYNTLQLYAEDLLGTGPEDVQDPERALEIAHWAADLTNCERHGAIMIEAAASLRLGRIEEGIAYCREVLRLPEGLRSWSTERELVDTLIDEGRFEEAERDMRDLIERREASMTPDDWMIGYAALSLSNVYFAAERWEEAEAAARDALARAIRGPGETSAPAFWTRRQIGRALTEQARFEEAEAELRAARVIQDEVRETDDPVIRDAFIRLYEAWGKSDLATKWRNGGGD